jgi:hypothetical protein
MGDGIRLGLLANLSPKAVANDTRAAESTPIWGGEAERVLPAWSVHWRLG